MGIRYFKSGDGYLGVTNETPAGPLRGLIFRGRGPLPGKGIESVCEQAYATDQLAKLERVSALDVPDAWFKAIGLEPKKRKRKRRRRKVQPETVELVVEMPGDRFRQMVLSPRGTAGYHRWRRTRRLFYLELTLAILIAWWLVFMWQYS